MLLVALVDVLAAAPRNVLFLSISGLVRLGCRLIQHFPCLQGHLTLQELVLVEPLRSLGCPLRRLAVVPGRGLCYMVAVGAGVILCYTVAEGGLGVLAVLSGAWR